MIPILYGEDEISFASNGIGVLSDITFCNVTEERNGSYEIEFRYPVSGALFEYIQEGGFVKAKANETSALQIFRIYKSTKPLNGIVTYYGEHISYELTGNPIEKVTVANETALSALNKVLDAALVPHSYMALSDIETLGTTTLALISTRAALGGVEGSLLDVYGGEFEFDNFTIKLHANRGRDTGIIIGYGKNLTDLTQEKNISEAYTALFPYAKYTPEKVGEEEPEEVIVTLSEKIMYSSEVTRPKVLTMDFTDKFTEGEAITEETLRNKATAWATESGYNKPSVSIKVSFVHLWQSPEYEKYAKLERVSLCDTVTVNFEKLGVKAKAKVIKTIYDTLKEKYVSIELGDAKSNFADTMNTTKQEIESAKESVKKETSAAQKRWEAAIKNATELITGQKGGYVVLNPSENPQEILIMDSPSITEAVKIWRWNSAGLGYSSSGYNGPYRTAITQDGSIVADFITAGLFEGALLKAGTVSAEAISQTYTEEILGKTGEVVADVEQRFTVANGELSSRITTVSDNVAEVSSSVEQNTEKISLAVSRIDTLDLATSNLEASITTTADGIRAQVQEEFIGVKDNISSLQSQVDINASGIRSVVTKVYGATIEGDGTPAEYSKSQAAEDIPLDESCLYYDRLAEKYYCYDVLDEDWVECDGSGSVQTAFLQTADGFYMNGDLIMDGTIKASSIDTEELSCTRLYAKGNFDGYSVRLNSDYGDFGIFTPFAEETDTAVDSSCIWGVWHNSGAEVLHHVRGQGWLIHNYIDNVTYPQGNWDFIDSNVSNLTATAVFGA